MGTKLGKREIPGGHSKDDFECFGPAATKDGDFDGTKIADLGCFTQDGRDTNKAYHGSVVKSKKTGSWYAYFEWGRTGASQPDFQFVECSSEQDAQEEYESQLHSKNDKRGEWATLAGMKTLRDKPGKDCYLVRPQSTRSTGLPDARRICSNEGVPKSQVLKTAAPTVSAAKSSTPSLDRQTLSLLNDLNVATVQYAKGAMANASIPTMGAIDEARKVLMEAQKRLLLVGDDVHGQTADRTMNDLTRLLYSRIPKIKAVGAPPETWVLSKNNIFQWNQDLDAFEQALVTQSSTPAAVEKDPLAGWGLEMQWLDTHGEHEWLATHAAKASRNVHHNVGPMRIKNVWKVFRRDDESRFRACQERIAAEGVRSRENPLFQPLARKDVPQDRWKTHSQSKTCLLFHGTRSCNASSCLRTGLRLPNQLKGVVITGAMFGGPAVYLADDWRKSAGYTSLRGSYWSGGSGSIRGRDAFMFMVDAVLGNPYVAPGAGTWSEAPRGHHSVFGKASVSGVANNEFIIYKIEQQALRYLIEFDA